MSRQPLEGLTVRIFDPPKSSEESTSGSRGYREYTEVVGSDQLRNRNYNWNKKKMSANGIKQSTKDWESDTQSKKSEKVQDLSLVKIAEIQGVQDKKKWESIVDLFRKLREGIFASNWSKGNYAFSTEVYESSVDCSIKASNYGELVKSLSVLMQLYELQNYTKAKPYYTALDIIYHTCYNPNLNLARERITCLKRTFTNESRFVKDLVKSVSTQNSILYFKLYYNNPYPAFRFLMDNRTDYMRIKAIAILRKVYLSASISWIGKWLGIYHDNNAVIQELERLVKPTCIKSIDNESNIVYFTKK
ncbi:hypothetical protein INT46_011737 [Mucor plumbeus]|uniref:PCI domain-containing protein n=1 Tax=Mucor plumbeus TaxID=97098 RepID=A0A8H7RSD1_9FUNG|nr:hypothetical protein INT46_011737 [Mucor plumbeus]